MAKKSRRKQPARGEAGPKRGTPAPDLTSQLRAHHPIRRDEFKLIGLVFAIGLALRIAYFFINKSTNPLFDNPILDALFHHEWAGEILSGNFWGDEVFFRAPLYPYLLASLYKISGSSIAFAVFCQHLIGSVNVALIYVLARQYFSVRVSVVSGVIAALYWPLIYFESELLIVTFFVFLVLLLLISLSLAMRLKRRSLFFVSGLLLGLAAVTRPSILIFLPFVPWAFYLAGRSARNSGAKRPWLLQSATLAIGLVIVVVPVMVRNYVVGSDIVPIASQGGVNFYIGNNPQANGSQAMVPGARVDLYGTYQGAIELAENDVGRVLKPSQVSNYYFRKGVDFWTDSPGDAGSLLMKKLYFFWAAVERSNNKYIQFFWRHYGLGKVPLIGFWLVGPFGLLGGALLWSRRRELALLYLFTASYMVGVVVFFVNARFRLPVAPLLIIFAAYSLCFIYQAFRAKHPATWKALAILVVCLFVVNYDYTHFQGVRAYDEAVTYLELGNAHLDAGDKASALGAYEKARELNERYPLPDFQHASRVIYYRIGVLNWEKGLLSRAIESIERIPESDPMAVDAGYVLAECYVKKGRTQDAIRRYSLILNSKPGDAHALLGLGVALRASGDLDRSLAVLQDLSGQRHGLQGPVNLELARTLEARNEWERAAAAYEAAAQDRRSTADAYRDMARLYRKMGQTDKAIEYLERLRAQFPSDRAIEAELRALRGNS